MFWRALLYGSPDALISQAHANDALCLVATNLLPIGNTNVSGEFSGTVRAGALRKALLERFGAKVWDVMNKLWQAAPTTDGCPQPNPEERGLPPGPLPVGRNQPRWAGELNEPRGMEREWLTENGLWRG